MNGFLSRVWGLIKLNPILYRPIKAEYVRFGRSNEYLITDYRLRWARPKRLVFETTVERCIGCTYYGRYFSDRLKKLKSQGVEITYHPDMSLEEFDSFAKNHPLLKKDSWVRMHLQFINNLPTYHKPGTF